MKRVLITLFSLIISLNLTLQVLADKIGTIDGNTAVRNELNLTGDANRNGIVDAEDALYILRKSAKILDPVWGILLPDNIEWTDIDTDGRLTAVDALEVLKISAKLKSVEMKQPELDGTYYYNVPISDDLAYPQETIVIDSYEKLIEVKSYVTANYPEAEGKMGISFLELIDELFFADNALILCIRSSVTGRDYYAIKSKVVEGNRLLLNLNQLWVYEYRKYYDDILDTNAYQKDDIKNRLEMIYTVVHKDDISGNEVNLTIKKLTVEDEVDTDLYVNPTPAPGGDEWYYDMLNENQGDY